MGNSCSPKRDSPPHGESLLSEKGIPHPMGNPCSPKKGGSLPHGDLSPVQSGSGFMDPRRPPKFRLQAPGHWLVKSWSASCLRMRASPLPEIVRRAPPPRLGGAVVVVILLRIVFQKHANVKKRFVGAKEATAQGFVTMRGIPPLRPGVHLPAGAMSHSQDFTCLW